MCGASIGSWSDAIWPVSAEWGETGGCSDNWEEGGGGWQQNNKHQLNICLTAPTNISNCREDKDVDVIKCFPQPAFIYISVFSLEHLAKAETPSGGIPNISLFSKPLQGLLNSICLLLLQQNPKHPRFSIRGDLIY